MEQDWVFPYEQTLYDVAPALHGAQAAWLAAIDSLTILDRKTHELIRMVCTAALRNPSGVERHAQLATEAGATWDEVVCALALTQPAFGVLPAVEALEPARAGFDQARAAEVDEETEGG